MNLFITDLKHLFKDNPMNVAPFVESPQEVVRKMLRLAEAKSGELLYDLGSGDGRIVITASSEFNTHSIGIELREDLVRKSRYEIARLGLEEKAQIVNNDFFEIDLSKADIITLYLTTSANEKLRPKLDKELKINTRIVSHDYEVRGWIPAKISRDDPPGHTIYLYIFNSEIKVP